MTDVTRRGVLTVGATAGVVAGIGLVGVEPAHAALPTLKRGSTGTAVKRLQALLNSAGYWCGTPDGSFGYNTQQAVYAVQKANSLTRTGVVSGTTWAKVEAGTKPSVRPKPSTWTDAVVLHINLAKQIMMTVKYGKVTRTVNISSGNGEYYWFQGRQVRAITPKGAFKVYFTDSYGNRSPRDGWREGELGAMYRPQFFTTNIAVHGSGSVPPYPASHGCARVSCAVMDMLWSTGEMKMGRRVWVY